MKKEMDPMLAASKVFENDRVRVLRVISKPGEVAKMHHHPDHVVYAVNGGKAALTVGGKTQTVELKTGSVNFFEAQDHEMKNVGNTTLELVVVELKK